MMRNLVLASIAVSFLSLSSAAAAQPMGRSGGWGPGGQYGRFYDPKTVETVKGEIEKVERLAPLRGMSAGIHLVLKTENGPLTVHLGPEWYLSKQDVKLSPKETVEVKGSRVLFQGKHVIIAAEVIKGDETLTLRDPQGIPVWSGWRKRAP